MTKKPFLTLNEQIKHLENDKHILCATQEERISVAKYGYFNLVNGYKDPFVFMKDSNGSHIYLRNTSIKQFVALKIFDDKLRFILFPILTRVEEEIRTLFAYFFDFVNKRETSWVDKHCYAGDDSDIGTMINNIRKSLEERRSSNEYLDFYLQNHDPVPIWIVTKSIDFSLLISMISKSNKNVIKELCKIYSLTINGIYSKKLLLGSLHWIRIARNHCAHNDRIFCLFKNGRIIENNISGFGNSYTKAHDLRCFDLLVFLKYYMEPLCFGQLCQRIRSALDKLQKEIPSQSFDRVRSSMGIKQKKDISLLQKGGKVNDYSNVMKNEYSS